MGKAPKGSQLAAARMQAHACFDPLWKSGEMTRSQAYAWLADQLKIPKDECHMLMFDEATCEKVILLCAPFMFRGE